MACDKGFSSNYMLLDPKDLGFFDLLHLLFSNNLERRRFVDSSEVTEDDPERRWLIFLSIVVQKLLQFVAKPMSTVGWAIEMCLNLVPSNGGDLVGLLRNILRGKVVLPDKSSRTFLSFIGNLDKRVELDKNIKRGDGNYNAALSMMASKISYENNTYIETIVQDHWKMEFLGSYDFWNDYQGKATTQACMFRDRSGDYDTIVVAFRGTEPFDADAWISDFDISWYELEGAGRIHGGFMKALGLQKNVGFPEPEKIKQDDSRPALAYYAIRDILKKHMLENDKAKYIITGHSLGGALAILFPAVLTFHKDKDSELLLERLEGVYTFGQPRVGDRDFGQYMENQMKEHNIKYFRFVYSYDMVPRLPYDDKALMFKHFGTCLYYNRDYEVKVVPEEPNKNYFSPDVAIPMMMNAGYELMRSFTLPSRKGPDYVEGYFFRVFRLIGLAMPGAAAHCPQDYVNATRLGSSEVFLQYNHRQNQNASYYLAYDSKQDLN